METPGWTDLLRRYANILHPGNPVALEIFKEDTDDDDWPAISGRIEKGFNALWLTHEDYASDREKYATLISSGVSAFKLDISNYFKATMPQNEDQHLIDELATLTNVAKRSVAGVITTNYDNLLETVFTGYTTFIGQEQLLFGATQGVAEIYKIHGCCSDPESIVINAKDYETFNSRNVYLAAKLLTVFVEHPIIFLGYSISDTNVQSILSAITGCLSQEKLSLLKKRLVFIEFSRDELETPEISSHSINFGDDTSVEMTRVKLSNYLPLYSSLLSQKFQYNPKLLRQLKRDIYKLVTTNKKVDKFKIADIENDNDLANYEVVVGVGMSEATVTERDGGHNIPEAEDLFRDIIFDDGDFNIKSLTENALAALLRHHSHSLPIHKYVNLYRQQFNAEPPPAVLKDMKKSIAEFMNNGINKLREQHDIDSIEKLDSLCSSDEKKIRLFSSMKNLEGYQKEMKKFITEYLENNPNALSSSNDNSKSDLKRLIKIYDYLAYGQKKTPNTQ